MESVVITVEDAVWVLTRAYRKGSTSKTFHQTEGMSDTNRDLYRARPVWMVRGVDCTGSSALTARMVRGRLGADGLAREP